MKRTFLYVIAIFITMFILSACVGNEIHADNATFNTTVEQNRANAIVDTKVGVSTNTDKSVSNENSSSQVTDAKVTNAEYEQLNDELSKAQDENKQLKEDIKILQEQTQNTPSFSFSDLALSINGEDIPVNNDKAMVTIDGRDYVSKEFAEKLISEGQSITIKDDTLYIGKIVSEKANLFDKHINSAENCGLYDTETDSYGIIRSNVLYFYRSQSHNVVFALDKDYMFLKFTIAMSDMAKSDRVGIVVVKADGEAVYTSDTLNKQTAPFEVTDIVINNCKLLTIEYTSDYDNECLISDAVVYNGI